MNIQKIINWFKKDVVGLPRSMIKSDYDLIKDKFKNDVGTKVYFKFDTGDEIISLKKNHLEYYYKKDKEKHIFRNYYDDMLEGMWVKYANIKFSDNDNKTFLRLTFRGTYSTTIDIYKSKKDCAELIKQLNIRHHNFVKRLLDEYSKDRKKSKEKISTKEANDAIKRLKRNLTKLRPR